MKTIYRPALSFGKFLIGALLLAALISSPFTTSASAAEGEGQRVVLLDIGRVFKQHAAFNGAMESMQQEVNTFRAHIEQEQAKIQTMAEQLRGLPSDSEKAIQLEATLTKMTADLQVEHQLKNKEFVQREAKLYYQTYADITATVSSFCDQHAIALVLRHVEDTLDSQDRASVLQRVNNPVVFQLNRDITDQIIREVNSPVAQQARAPHGPTK